MQALKEQLKALYNQLFALANLSTPQGEKIFTAAAAKLGTDASPKDRASDELGCAESVSEILAALYPPFQVVSGTYTLYLALKGALEFVEVTKPLPGDVVISPTGLGGNAAMPNGHTGIVGKNNIIMSNDSSTGLWKANYTLDSWTARYKTRGLYPVKFFRRII